MVRMLDFDQKVMSLTPGPIATKCLLLGWVSVCGQVNKQSSQVNHLGVQPTPRSTQPSNSIPLEQVNQVLACLAGVRARHVHLCRVAGNTV